MRKAALRPVVVVFHGFDGVADGDRRIDWVLPTADLTALLAGTSRYQEGGHYVSDHFPRWARLAPLGAVGEPFSFVP